MSRAVKGMGVALLTLVLIALSVWGVLATGPVYLGCTLFAEKPEGVPD